MALRSEEESILEAIVAGIPHIALVITAMPAKERAKALEAVQRSYLRTMRNFGFEETASQTWASAAMRRLRWQMEQCEFMNQKMLRSLFARGTGATGPKADKNSVSQEGDLQAAQRPARAAV